jgi:hypothetical protein
MERNVVEVKGSRELRAGARALVDRSVAAARILLNHAEATQQTARGGRKAHRLSDAAKASGAG